MTTPPPGRLHDGRAVVVYTVLRLALFVGCLGLAWVVGFSGFVLLVVALLASGVLSWFLLRRQRLAMGAAVDASAQRVRERMRARAAAEDAYVDQLHDASADRA